MVKQYDVIVIGAGHNGLTTAAYLARAGKRVVVLERRPVVGGAAVTETFHPGFRNSVASYTVSLLHPKVIDDLDLHAHGLRIVERPFSNFMPLENDYLATGPDLEATQKEFARHSERDAKRLPDYYDWLENAADVLREELLRCPPDPNGGLAELWRTSMLARRLRKRSVASQQAIFELFTRSAAEILEHWFENPHIRALFAFDSVVGNYASPYSTGSGYILLHHVFGEVNGKSGAWGHAIGGMGAISEAIARDATGHGAVIRCDAAVARIEISADRVAGVRLSDGEVVHAPIVAANCTPKHLLLDLVPEPALTPVDRQTIKRTRYGSGTFRMNVALDGLPRFRHRPQRDDYLGSGIIIAPTMQYMDNAYYDARRLGWSRSPIVEMLIPSTLDDSLAPPGQHVASLFCQHVAPTLPDGRDWHEARDEVAALMIDTVDQHAPGFRDQVLGIQALSPADLESHFGLTGGDIFHGALSLSQLYSARPAVGMAQYRMPIPGLYLCGAGAHPGGGVTGIPGHNAAREILKAS